MRLAAAVILGVLLQLAAWARLPQLSYLTELETLYVSALLGLWALAELYLVLSRTKNASQPPSAVPTPAAQPKQQTVAAAAHDSERLSLLEAERDQLREQAAASTLRQKEQDEQLAQLRNKCSTLEKNSAACGNEDAIAQRAVLSFLGTLQEKGRLLDFLMDDLSAYSDVQVGAAARVVHQGCAAVVREQLSIVPVHAGAEGEDLELRAGYNPREWRLVGRVRGQPPFSGRVLHKGWKVERFNLARLSAHAQAALGQGIGGQDSAAQASNGQAAAVVVPAELEVA